jgi:hypothetical protein
MTKTPDGIELIEGRDTRRSDDFLLRNLEESAYYAAPLHVSRLILISPVPGVMRGLRYDRVVD